MINPFIIANAEKCISCRTCEVACALAHSSDALQTPPFSPRLQLVKTFNISVPVVCRQCENAPCANVCPHDAIVRSKKGHWDVIQDRCIGCKSCVVACPFGAINVVVSYGNPAQVNSEAHKCDLCSSQPEGPACISACPTNALVLVNERDLKQHVAQKQQRTANNDVSISSSRTFL
ncbi:electron transport protein HydN [Serratia fonticola]|uniref:Electron transport protein HydN n=1 Tax=Serratia fonticola TaxID=47917 RepID=A0A559T280_SERFO|nr:electron transport protein HydN [Serratia fonticola]TQI99189.1 electron transport protein HydN [Serratia fonticola]TVZ68714.1 electron transport protein HydN [Serratia fonticola]